MGFNFPNTPAAGETYTPVGGPMFVWDGVAWKSASQGVPVTVYVSDTAPAQPALGQMWWESDSGALFVWYADGDSAQWVQINGLPAMNAMDRVVSVPEDMFFGNKGSTSWLWKDKADGSGNVIAQLGNTGMTWQTISLDPGAAAGPNWYLDRFSPSPAVADKLGAIWFRGKNSATTTFNYAGIEAILGDPVAGSEDANLNFSVVRQGSYDTVLTLNQGGAQFRSGSQVLFNDGYSSVGAVYGATFNTYWLRFSANATTSHYPMNFYNPNGSVGGININGSATAFITSSDANLKNVSGEYDPDEAIAIIRADPVMDWTWKTKEADRGIGWVAQKSFAVNSNLAVEPEPPKEGEVLAAFGDEDYQPWGIDYGKRTPYLWAALSRALDKIDALEARLAALEDAA